jgi:hypothetical protein
MRKMFFFLGMGSVSFSEMDNGLKTRFGLKLVSYAVDASNRDISDH